MKILKRICKDCGKLHEPTGKATKYCDSCRDKRLKARTEKVRAYLKLPKEQKRVSLRKRMIEVYGK